MFTLFLTNGIELANQIYLLSMLLLKSINDPLKMDFLGRQLTLKQIEVLELNRIQFFVVLHIFRFAFNKIHLLKQKKLSKFIKKELLEG